MKNLLMNCYYDKMNLQEAINFISRTTGEAPTEKSIKTAQSKIKKLNNKEWK